MVEITGSATSLCLFGRYRQGPESFAFRAVKHVLFLLVAHSYLRRDLIKAYGIRLVFQVEGQGLTTSISHTLRPVCRYVVVPGALTHSNVHCAFVRSLLATPESLPLLAVLDWLPLFGCPSLAAPVRVPPVGCP